MRKGQTKKKVLRIIRSSRSNIVNDGCLQWVEIDPTTRTYAMRGFYFDTPSEVDDFLSAFEVALEDVLDRCKIFPKEAVQMIYFSCLDALYEVSQETPGLCSRYWMDSDRKLFDLVNRELIKA